MVGSLCASLWGKKFRREVILLLIPPAIYLAVAMFSGVNYGVRHLLPVYPFLIVLVAFGAWNLGQRHRALASLVAGFFALPAASLFRGFPPHSFSPNGKLCGAADTHRVLSESNNS